MYKNGQIENLTDLANHLQVRTTDGLGVKLSDLTLFRHLRRTIQVDKAPIDGYLDAIYRGNGSDEITGVFIGAGVSESAPRPVEPRWFFFPFQAVLFNDAWLGIEAEHEHLCELAGADE